MKVDKNGVIISDITGAQDSAMNPNYIVMWDSDGIMIHINKSVVAYLCEGMYGEKEAPDPTPEIKLDKLENIQSESPVDDSINVDDLFFT